MSANHQPPPALDLAGLAETAKEATAAYHSAPRDPDRFIHMLSATSAFDAAVTPDVFLALCAELTALRERVSEGERGVSAVQQQDQG